MENGTVGGRTPAKNTTEIISPQNIVAQGIGHGFALTILAVFLGQPLFNDLIALDDIIKGIYLPALEGASAFGTGVVALTNQLLVNVRMQRLVFYQLCLGFFVKFIGDIGSDSFFFGGGRGKGLKRLLILFVFFPVCKQHFYIAGAFIWVFFNLAFHKAVKIVAVKLGFGIDAEIVSMRIGNIQ